MELRRFMFFPTPTCSGSCDADLPPTNFSTCSPVVPFSEIQRIFMAKSSAEAFTDWTQASEWTTRISQTSVSGDDYIRVLTVIADKPQAASVVREISNGRRIVVGKDHTINFTIDDVSDENYEFMRALECGGQFRIWYETAGGYMYGGNEGQLINIDAGDVLNRGREETETIAGTMTWRAKFHPERVASPIFGISTDTGAPTTYNVIQTFASLTTDTDAGVTTTVAATDPDTKFEFNSIASPSGLANTMTLRIATVQVAQVDFPSDYANTYFRFTSAAGTVYVKQFKDGTVNLA
jgi:hypothetical protein